MFMCACGLIAGLCPFSQAFPPFFACKPFTHYFLPFCIYPYDRICRSLACGLSDANQAAEVIGLYQVKLVSGLTNFAS